ncbi:hypothetical protein ZWY2020_036742 [Hordeum vulgare]|nr:hypothetical protein ZWY2020_036742 [Hordeum vulgare]
MAARVIEAHSRRGARVLDRRRPLRHPQLHPHGPLRAAPKAARRAAPRREDVHVDGVRADVRLPRHGGDRVPAAGDERGDWLVFDDMGVYTTASGSNFNGFSTSDIKTYLAYSS